MTGCEKKSGTVIKIAKLFGYVSVKLTMANGLMLKSKLNAVNLAYTNFGLQGSH